MLHLTSTWAIGAPEMHSMLYRDTVVQQGYNMSFLCISRFEVLLGQISCGTEPRCLLEDFSALAFHACHGCIQQLQHFLTSLKLHKNGRLPWIPPFKQNSNANDGLS